MDSCGSAVAVALAVTAVLGAAPAQAAPLPDFCTPVVEVCTARLTSVTADVVNGTITGTPVGGGPALTLTGQGEAYLKSAGFGTPLPAAIQTWDTTIDQVGGLDVAPSDPNWYGNAKARVFLPRTLNDLAVGFPPGTLVVSFTAGDAYGPYQLVSIQPTLA
ncbi:hypothetical protein [Mycobacterium sp. C31M]